MVLAIFDLDNTLLAGDSDHAWGEFLCDKGYVDEENYRRQNDDFYQDYLRGKLDIFAYQRFALSPLVNKSQEQLTRWHREFMEQSIKPLLLPKAVALLQQHREQGDFLLIITATNRFVTEPIAKRLGVDHLIATEPELNNGTYSGEIAGTPCYQEGKVERLQQWLAHNELTMEGSFFYSDSHNDLALLKLVDHPVAVDPDETLRQHAKIQGWPIISLR